LDQLNATEQRVTDAVRQRNATARANYLQHIEAAIEQGPVRKSLSCTNQAHAFAPFPQFDKNILVEMRQPSIDIISAYSDMLSAHPPLQHYPELIDGGYLLHTDVQTVAGAGR